MLAPEVVAGAARGVPAAKVVVFTAHGDHHGVQAALDAGAHGALLKDAAATDLVAALRRVLRGERVSTRGWCRAPRAGGRPRWPAAA